MKSVRYTRYTGEDFGISAEGLGLFDQAGADGRRWTYANLGLCKPGLVTGVPSDQPLPLRPVFQREMAAGRIRLALYEGRWGNIGTPGDLAEFNAQR